MDREPSAAEALYPTLRQALPDELPPRRSSSVASAMYPRKPSTPSPDPKQESYLRYMKAMGFVRKEGR
jgi:hypothetical protein